MLTFKELVAQHTVRATGTSSLSIGSVLVFLMAEKRRVSGPRLLREVPKRPVASHHGILPLGQQYLHTDAMRFNISQRPGHLPLLQTVALIASVAVILTLVVGSSAQAENSATIEAKVSKVLDGDTFTLRGESRRIRVWGLDAPEWDQRGGSNATATLRSLISGETLRCSVLDIDRYGRLVGQCLLPNGRDIAAEMIRSGAAREFCRYSHGYYGTC
jgi:micrococcal nuclease